MVTTASLLLLAALATAEEPSCAAPAVGVELGVGLDTIATDNPRPAFIGGASVAWDLGPCLPIPLRLEAGLTSGTRGPPWWGGVEAVAVRVWSVELTAGAGMSVSFWDTENESMSLGLDLLGGAALRIIGVATRVQGGDSIAHELRGLGRVLAGLFLRLESWRLQLRVDWLFVLEPSFLAGVAFQF